MLIYERSRSESREYLYNQFDIDLNFHLHLHRSFEFIYVKEGLLQLSVNKKTFSLEKGQAALILPGQLHAYSTPSHSQSYLCIFSCDFVYDFYKLIRNKKTDNPTFLLGDLSIIERLTCPDNNRFIIKSALYSVAGSFLDNCRIDSYQNNNHEPLEQILDYVQTHFREKITLKSLSEKLGYHYNYLSSYLNEKFEINFSELVNLYRVDYACELLDEDTLSITDVAQESGFETIRSFNRNFKKIQSCTPMEYRKQKTEKN